MIWLNHFAHTNKIKDTLQILHICICIYIYIHIYIYIYIIYIYICLYIGKFSPKQPAMLRSSLVPTVPPGARVGEEGGAAPAARRGEVSHPSEAPGERERGAGGAIPAAETGRAYVVISKVIGVTPT